MQGNVIDRPELTTKTHEQVIPLNVFIHEAQDLTKGKEEVFIVVEK